LLSYRPPTRPLRIGGRPPAVKPEAPEARDHAERGLRAFEALVAEQGYVETTMEQVAKRAAMSAKTLYANFDGKQELLLAAIDSAGAQIVAAVMPAFRRNAGWPEGVRAGLGALLGLLASRPAMARLAMVELFAGGPAALRRRTEALRPLQALLAGGRHYSPQAPAIAPEAILAGIVALCRKAIDGSGPESLPSLLPVATYVALAPFLGAEEATATAIGEAGRGERRELALTQASDRMRVILSQRTATPQEIAAEIGIPVDEVLAQLEHLFKVGLVQQVDERTTGQGIEPVYAGANQKLGTERWSEISLEERQRISAEIRRGIAGDVERAVESGSFDARVDRYLARVPFWVDEEGWREIGDVLEVALANCLEIQTRSNARLSGATTGGFSARAVFALFEVPEAGDQEGPARPD
jgi:AcrR family transcriptional regulator